VAFNIEVIQLLPLVQIAESCRVPVMFLGVTATVIISNKPYYPL